MLITRVRPSIWVSWLYLNSFARAHVGVNAVPDSNDGANMGFPHYVSCSKQGLFDPLRVTLLYRVGRVNLFPCHPGMFMVSYDGSINYSLWQL
jgi:hypothetical protein